MQGAHRANRRAGGFLAMHAESPHENAPVRLDHIQLTGGQNAPQFVRADALGKCHQIIILTRG